MSVDTVSYVESTFARTLVLGASVSAAAVERNPTKRFLRQHGLLGGAVTHAQDGVPGAKLLSQVKKAVLDQVTAVVAIDLLFWDSVIGLGNPRDAQAYLRGFFKELRQRKLPIILGRIPGFHELQIHRHELNSAIEREVQLSREAGVGAEILPLDELFVEVSRDEGIHIDGRHHRLEELIPDGLHPGPVAAEFIAREIGRTAQRLVSPKTR